jgi:phage recombination protein Bet
MTDVQTLPTAPQRLSLIKKMANRFSIEPERLKIILKATAFHVRDGEVSDEQMAALLVVADQFGLNPFTRELFAFPDRQNGIVPVVSVDGWSRIINDHPQADGIEFRYSEDLVTLPDAQPCPKWCEVVLYRKDRGHPTIVREYLEECYRPAFKRPDGSKVLGPWQTHTKRFLRHKTLIQGSRIAFGFGGIYDEDEARRIAESTPVLEAEPPKRGAAALREAARAAVDAPPAAPASQGGAIGEGAASPTAPDQEEAPEAATERPMEDRLADAIAYLDELSTVGEVDAYVREVVPDEVAAIGDFAKAVERRLAAIRAKKAK